jgi:WD40 repeat protein
VYDVEVTRGQRSHGTISLDVPLDRLLALPDSVAGFSGAVAATRKGGYSLYVCDLERGAIRTRLFGHLGQVEQMSASERLPNMLASASWDTCTKIWDLRTSGAVCTLKVRRPKVKFVSIFFFTSGCF